MIDQRTLHNGIKLIATERRTVEDGRNDKIMAKSNVLAKNNYQRRMLLSGNKSYKTPARNSAEQHQLI